MAYDRDRKPDMGGAAAVILVALILGILVLAVGGFFFLAYSRSQSQMVMARNQAVAAQEKAAWVRVQAEQEREQLLAEADPDEPDSATVRQVTIAIDKDGNASVDGNSMQLDELQSQLRTISDESSDQLSAVIQVDDKCRFEHVARILSLCEEAGIARPKLESSDE